MTLVALIVLMMFLAGLVESAAWAGALMGVGAFSEFEPAFYFSTVTFTTLGYGDVLIHDRWRLLATFAAANGIIMFGWTTASSDFSPSCLQAEAYLDVVGAVCLTDPIRSIRSDGGGRPAG